MELTKKLDEIAARRCKQALRMPADGDYLLTVMSALATECAAAALADHIDKVALEEKLRLGG